MTPNRKILIADDDPAIVRTLARQCARLGLEVETASNGLTAILKATRNPPRLLILDVKMPEADGFRVCEWMLDIKKPPVDVVILTASSDLETLDRCDSLGAYHVEKSPATWGALTTILNEIFDIGSEPPAAFPPEPADQPSQQLVPGLRNKVLIVEDDADLAYALERRLRKCGAVTLRASNGIEAYRMAVNERPDVVVTDYVMPEAGGHYLIWRMKDTKETKYIPIIVITGHRPLTGTDLPGHIGTDGVVKYFEKPLDLDALFYEVSRH